MDMDDFDLNQPPQPPFDDFKPARRGGGDNSGNNSPLQQGTVVPKDFKPTASQPLPPVRCTGIVRNGERKGQQCGKWSIEGASVCIVHGGRLPNVKEAARKHREAAKLRLLGLSDDAIDTFESLLKPGTADQVRLGAAKEILDRAGITKDADLTVEVKHSIAPSEIISNRLREIANRKLKDQEEALEDQGEVLDAETGE